MLWKSSDEGLDTLGPQTTTSPEFTLPTPLARSPVITYCRNCNGCYDKFFWSLLSLVCVLWKKWLVLHYFFISFLKDRYSTTSTKRCRSQQARSPSGTRCCFSPTWRTRTSRRSTQTATRRRSDTTWDPLHPLLIIIIIILLLSTF